MPNIWKPLMPTRTKINCSRCGKEALVRVGAAYCSPECQKANKDRSNASRDRKQAERRSEKRRAAQQTEADKYHEAMGKVRL